MAKTKTPFLSLGSKGTVGGSLTSQKRGSATLLREKPMPTDPLTLPQQYQRWLYQDYAHLWKQQNEATRRSFAATGSRRHLTGFQYWMKYQLTNLPDIAAWWKLDEKAGAIAHDSSRNANHGTIYGATSTTGPIDGALYFDGINDVLIIPANPTLQNFTQLSFFFFAYLPPFTGNVRFFTDFNYSVSPFGFRLYLHALSNRLNMDFQSSIGFTAGRNITFTPDTWLTAGFTWDGINIQCRLNNTIFGTIPFTGTLACSANNPTIGAPTNLSSYAKLTLDNVILLNRPLNNEQWQRYSLRRYPA